MRGGGGRWIASARAAANDAEPAAPTARLFSRDERDLLLPLPELPDDDVFCSVGISDLDSTGDMEIRGGTTSSSVDAFEDVEAGRRCLGRWARGSADWKEACDNEAEDACACNTVGDRPDCCVSKSELVLRDIDCFAGDGGCGGIFYVLIRAVADLLQNVNQ